MPKNTADNYNDAHKFVKLSTGQRVHIERIKDDLSNKYRHLNPRFYDDSICMQAKIDINIPRGQSLLKDPGLYADILQTEHFIPESFQHYRTKASTQKRDGQQYVLTNDTLKSIGHDFVLKATFGPSFISLWFRNESSCADLEVPLCYAFEIMNKLYDRINRISTGNTVKNIRKNTYQINARRKAS